MERSRLLDGAEHGLQEDGALEFVVAEVALDVGPEGERRDARLVDEVVTEQSK